MRGRFYPQATIALHTMKIINSKPLSNTAYIAKRAVINIPEKG